MKLFLVVSTSPNRIVSAIARVESKEDITFNFDDTYSHVITELDSSNKPGVIYTHNLTINGAAVLGD